MATAIAKSVGLVGVSTLFTVLTVIWAFSGEETEGGRSQPRNSATESPDPLNAVVGKSPTQVEQSQKDWGQFLGLPVEVSNTLGMKLRLLPPGEFTMGKNPIPSVRTNPREHIDYAPAHRVRLTQPLYVGKFEVTVGEFRRFCDETRYAITTRHDYEFGSGVFENGDFGDKKEFSPWSWGHPDQSDEHPVVNVTWHDAVAFCEWLSNKEGKSYRLLTEAEWEYACRAGSTTDFWNGDEIERQADVANVYDEAATKRFGRPRLAIRSNDGYALTAPVGRFRSNPFGLCDTHGNVSEWCQDWYCMFEYSREPAEDPTGRSIGALRVIRGSDWRSTAWHTSFTRVVASPTTRDSTNGFRVARDIDRNTGSRRAQPEAKSAQRLSHAIEDDGVDLKDPDGKVAGETRKLTSLKMAFSWCPAGRFKMGSDVETQVNVVLSRGFWLAQTEVTQSQWQEVMGTTPWRGTPITTAVADIPECPASYVSWNDAIDFCSRLTSSEQKAGRLPKGWIYALPTEAQWEYACRAGSNTRYSFGTDAAQFSEYGWAFENASPCRLFPNPVATKKPNQWNLYDMHGNVGEYCSNFLGKILEGGTDPTGPLEGEFRVGRGGCWVNRADQCVASERARISPENADRFSGFRIARLRRSDPLR